ncbi:mitochondrial peptidyl-tRNA hydrolase [Xylaria sp. FL1042]|nr:mitochondrial peptidyl-tRNA hydrolase [Xylaria sp. FL1042]
MTQPRFLVISLGNAAPYFDRLHSAGHFAIAAAHRALAPQKPEFSPQKYSKKKCKASWWAEPYTFIQSPMMMNVCGPWVHGTWKEILEKHNLRPEELALVLVHDELEAAFGKVKARKWQASHHGHNGVKSVRKSMDPLNYPCDRWRRITVGISRPKERTSSAVSDHVLSKITPEQLKTIETDVAPEIIRCLSEMKAEWEQNPDAAPADS